ncbi:SusC/RagA family TonB-linked outer membrane protein [Pedobacter sandarakinus]|uniref:SusC/RagA family TonB-linked outer membrane protein n=1 Tax=Pedobacter sandarakinus TaxID=353156 RepID=UPI002246B421|nr:SusC/RagA family TonB-linked outer membrane protein [Pedobacter sandarakinus]MCX2573152.1 SusC/RagA family TonB-linked outer membrane protein [Pedobacter sandarakinus]
MKLACIMVFITCLNVSASVFSQEKISLDVKKAKLGKVLQIIEQQSSYHFVYSSAYVPVNRDVSITVTNTLVSDVLAAILSKTNLKFSISDGGLIVISRNKEVPISGTVKDGLGGALPGASVRVKGTGIGTSTDINGKFSLNAPENATLVVSYAGFQTKEIAIGAQTTIAIVLSEDTKQLTDVVVTALGIKKERRALGYSVTQVAGETLTQARENNITNSLVGKVAGLDIASTSGGAGAATNVTIRGVSSLGSSSQPLYVVNGIPMESAPIGFGSNAGIGNNGGQYDNAPDLGDAISNLNPDDIESISVLKGAAASALYGNRAKAGVILITTKSGKGNSIEFSSNYVAEQVMDRTNWQYIYGQGVNGQKPVTQLEAASTGSSSWGARLDGSNVIQFDGVSRPYSAQKDNIEDFYRTGGSWTNTLALNKSFTGGVIRLSASDLTNRSVVPNSGLNRQNFTLSSTFDPIKNLVIDARVNYILEQANNRPMLSDGAGNANYNAAFLPTSVNIATLQPGKKADGNELSYNTGNPYATNPWFAANDFIHDTKRDRLLSSISAKYTFDNGLFLQARTGRDAYNDSYIAVTPSGTAYDADGGYTEQISKFSDINADALIGKSFKVDDFSITPNIGASFRRTKSESTNNGGSSFQLFGIYTLSNTGGKSVSVIKSDQETQSVYGTLELTYKDVLYLTGSARSDWFSTLATPGKDNKLNVIYPSVSGSFVFSELWKPSFLSFGKLRAGYAVVGDATDPFLTQLYYNLRSETVNGSPLGNIVNGSIPNASLRASKATELEIGTEMRFFGDRLNLDLTWYSKKSTDEILAVPTSTTTGYNGAVLNIGELRNRGVEALISGNILKNENFSWTSTINGSYNDNKVITLAPGTASQLLATSRSNVGFLQNLVGLPIGQVMAYDYQYDASGNIVKDTNGVPQRGELKPYGSSYNKWFAGWNNEFTFKGVNLSFLIDGKWGGKIFAATDYYGYIFGLHQATLENRDALGIGAANYYSTFANNVSKQFVQDASFIKFRQFILGYNFPVKMFNNRIKGLNVSFVGRNLFILMKKTDNIDPESSYNATIPGIELGGVPPVRTYGLNLSVKL